MRSRNGRIGMSRCVSIRAGTDCSQIHALQSTSLGCNPAMNASCRIKRWRHVHLEAITPILRCLSGSGTTAMREKVGALGLIPNDSPSIQDMRSYIESERSKWGAMVKQLGLEGAQ